MFIGQQLLAENYDDGGGGGVQANTSTVYTSWFPREGDGATFFVDIETISKGHTSATSTPTLKMTVQTKNEDEIDSARTEPGNVSSTSTGVKETSVSGLKELVRLKFELWDNTGSTPTARTFGSVFRPLAPSWESN